MSILLTQLDAIKCNYHRGCSATFEASPIGCCFSDETRRQAKAEGWEVAVSQRRRGAPRLDFCPNHYGDKEADQC